MGDGHRQAASIPGGRALQKRHWVQALCRFFTPGASPDSPVQPKICTGLHDLCASSGISVDLVPGGCLSDDLLLSKLKRNASAVAMMPAYYFHIRDNGVLLRDPDGLELPDLEAARGECQRLILSVLQEEQIEEQLSANREFQIEDETGRTVLLVPFRLAVTLARAGGR
jgi:hypothetical protein